MSLFKSPKIKLSKEEQEDFKKIIDNMERSHVEADIKSKQTLNLFYKDGTNTLQKDYYKSKNMEVIDIIEEYNLDFNLGNVVKYVLRAGKKDPSKYKEDLKKAIYYINRFIDKKLKDV